MKRKIIVIGRVLRHISPVRIICPAFIDSLFIQPFVKRAAVIKNTVQNDSDSSLMRLFYQLNKQLVARLQIFPVRHPVDISGCIPVVLIVRV